MHVMKIKEVVKVLTANGETNKETQSCLLGYIVGIEAPINLNTNNQDDNLEWNSFFNELPGEINEHYLLNLNLAQDVANLTLQYRQAVMNGSDKIEELAKRFLTITGSGFGLLGNEGTVRQIRQVLKEVVAEKRAGIEERMNARLDAQQAREESEKSDKEESKE